MRKLVWGQVDLGEELQSFCCLKEDLTHRGLIGVVQEKEGSDPEECCLQGGIA